MGLGQRIASFVLAISLGVGGFADMSAAVKLKAEDARKTIVKGIKSYEAGKSTDAVSSLTAALSSGGLTSKDMAKALYYRGLAYKKKGQTAKAISDLTSAIWLKGGLSETEKAKAQAVRSSLYTSAGVKNVAPVTAKKTSAPAPTSTAAAKPTPQAPKAQATKTQTTPAAFSQPAVVTRNTADTNSQVQANSAPPSPTVETQSATTSQIARQTISGQNAYRAPANNQGAAGSTTPASQTTTTVSNPLSGIGNTLSGVGTFFSNMFEGVTNAGQTTQPQPATAGFSNTVNTPTTAVSAWSSTTNVETGSIDRTASAKPKRVAAVQNAPARNTTKKPVRKAAPKKPSGDYRLQIASLKSRKEAEALAERLMRKHGRKFGTRVATVDERVYGNMGTFYRVQIGPYASTKEPQTVCSDISPDGYDCFVIKK